MKKGYQIDLEPKAIVYHFQKENPYSFFMQNYKYGLLGRPKLCRKHKIKDNQALELSFLLKDGTIVLDFLLRLTRGIVSKKERTSISILTPVFGALKFFVYRIGVIRGFKTIYSKEKNSQSNA